jgi:hypothetical protein
MSVLAVEKFTSFENLDLAYAWTNQKVNELIGSGEKVIANRIYQDLFRKPKFRQIKLLGVSKRAAKECERLAPGGKWWVQCEKTVNGYQFMAWYSKYLPYAYAMMQSEQGFEALGIDYDSINSYFRTVSGFVWIGMGEIVIENEPENIHSLLLMGENAASVITTAKASILDEKDRELYNNCYIHSNASDAPLPFFEAMRAAYCFVGLTSPKIYKKAIMGMGHRTESEFEGFFGTVLVRQVAKALEIAQPDFN